MSSRVDMCILICYSQLGVTNEMESVKLKFSEYTISIIIKEQDHTLSIEIL